MKRLLRFLFILFTSFLSLGFYISNRVIYIKKKNERTILEREINGGRLNLAQFNRLPKRTISIPSPFGYSIKAIVVEPHHTNKYIIFSHGVTENKMNSVKYMNIFLERGFNALIYDQRRHGESGGKTTSYGHFEKFDLKAVVDWLKKDRGENLLLGIHGESMGAATLLLYAGMIEDGAHFYIADCPFSDFKDQLAYRIKKETRLPPKLIVPIAHLFIKMRERYSLNEVSPITVIENIKKPILFIHSAKDDYILPAMTEELYKGKKGPKKLFLAKNGVHAQSFNENKEDYEEAIDAFLHDYVFHHKKEI